MVVVLMGVAGSGKTTLGRGLANELGWEFADADSFHPPANIAKMSAGAALEDADRAPWLAAIRRRIDDTLAQRKNIVITCSALKTRYRDALGVDRPGVRLVYLKGNRDTLLARLNSRVDHFMKPAMLDGQLSALEEPVHAETINVDRPPEVLVADIRSRLKI
jgi:carbohydrate kinase (thermoresistant glucokinase family)